MHRGKLSINKSDGTEVLHNGQHANNSTIDIENGRFHVAKVNSLGMSESGSGGGLHMSATSPGSLITEHEEQNGDAGGAGGGMGGAGQYNTYVYDTRYAKSLGQLTREALPKLDNYRDLMSVHNAYRPTLDELHNATLHEKVSKKGFTTFSLLILKTLDPCNILQKRRMHF